MDSVLTCKLVDQCAQDCFDRVCPYAGRNYNALLVCTCYEKRGPFNECVQGCDREFDRFITSLEVAEFCEQR